MPAEIVNSAFCADNFGVYDVLSSDGKTTYTVTMAGMSAHCTCKGFQFKQECKHITYVYRNACLWNPQWYDGNPDPTIRPKEYIEPLITGEECPVCGGPTVPVRIAV